MPDCPPSFREALRFWAKLGWISFGGPAGQIAIMHKELVEKRRWMSEAHFLHALNFCMLLPGPEAQQLATYLGWRLHGARGGIAAGSLFVLPSAAVLFFLSWLYMAGGAAGWVQGIFYGVIPAVIAIMFFAVRRIGSRVLKTPALWAVAASAFAAVFYFEVSFLLVVPVALAAGWHGGRLAPHQFPGAMPDHGSENAGEGNVRLGPVPVATWRRTAVVAMVCLSLWWLPIAVCGLLSGWQGIHFQLGVFFSKAALVTIGGAYAVLPYVSQMAVESQGWLDDPQMMAGLALAESTPGPLIMVLQFVGFVAAWQHPGGMAPLASASVGAAITTWVTFLPSFLFVFLGGPHVEGLREKPVLASMLTAVTAAVTGVIMDLAVSFASRAVLPKEGEFDGFVLIAALGAWIAMERFKVGIVPVLAACAALGIAWKNMM